MGHIVAQRFAHHADTGIMFMLLPASSSFCRVRGTIVGEDGNVSCECYWTSVGGVLMVKEVDGFFGWEGAVTVAHGADCIQTQPQEQGRQ